MIYKINICMATWLSGIMCWLSCDFSYWRRVQFCLNAIFFSLVIKVISSSNTPHRVLTDSLQTPQGVFRDIWGVFEECSRTLQSPQRLLKVLKDSLDTPHRLLGVFKELSRTLWRLLGNSSRTPQGLLGDSLGTPQELLKLLGDPWNSSETPQGLLKESWRIRG